LGALEANHEIGQGHPAVLEELALHEAREEAQHR